MVPSDTYAKISFSKFVKLSMVHGTWLAEAIHVLSRTLVIYMTHQLLHSEVKTYQSQEFPIPKSNTFKVEVYIGIRRYKYI